MRNKKGIRCILCVICLGIFIVAGGFFVTNTFAKDVNFGSFSILEKTDINNDDFVHVNKTDKDLKTGNLVLVNNEKTTNIDNTNKFTELAKNKNQAYSIANQGIRVHKNLLTAFNAMMSDYKKATGDDKVVVNSGYRGYDYQKKLFDDEKAKKGEREAKRSVAISGGSEHHTGLAVDLGVVGKNNITVNLSNDQKWIYDNCKDYGFILRYTGEKENITGIKDEPWHFRYVGVPHATIMANKNFCMEEYIDYLKKFEFSKKHLVFENYEIYYVKAKSGDIPVPKNKNYEISGNNVDGFIVTINNNALGN